MQGTVRVLECARARARCKKFVYAASSSCYGLAATPTREDHPIAPQYPYALSKYQGEQAAFHWHQVYRLPVNSIRIFNAYGPRVRTTGAYGAVFGVFFKQKLAGKPFTVVGDGTQRRDFLYVTDVAAAFLRAAETRHRRADLESRRRQSAKSSIGWSSFSAARSSTFPSARASPTAPGRISARSQRDLGWKPKVSFEEGVRRMLRRHRVLARRATVGSAVDRERDQDVVRVSGTGGLTSWTSLGSHYKHKIKTAGRDRAPRSAPRRASGR